MKDLNIIELSMPVNSFNKFHITNYPAGYPKNATSWLILSGTVTVKPIDEGTGIEMQDSSPGESIVAVTLRHSTYAILRITTFVPEITLPPIEISADEKE